MPIDPRKRNLHGYAGGEPRYRAARARCAIACRKFNTLPEDAPQAERAAAWAEIVCCNESSSRLLKESSACPARSSAALASPSPSPSPSQSPSTSPSPSPATPSWTRAGSALPQIGSQPYDANLGVVRVSSSRFPDESSPRLPDPAANNTGIPRDRHVNMFPGFGAVPYVKPPIFVDYGVNVRVGGTTFINRNCHILDTPLTSIEVGERGLFGPNVHLYGVTHTLDAAKRSDPSYDASSLAGDIKIGNDCWIGGNATILPGVTIGDGSVIGAGSVVTRDVPAHHLAVGVPARVMRRLDHSGSQNNGPRSTLIHAMIQLCKSRLAVPRLGHFPTMRSLEAKLIGLECTVVILLAVVASLLYLEVTRSGG